MTDLFSYEPYNGTPGFKEGDTSRAAAESMLSSSKVLQNRCLAALNGKPQTPDEVADFLCESVLSIRPRFTELAHMGRIIDTGDRRPNASMRSAKVWRVA